MNTGRFIIHFVANPIVVLMCLCCSAMTSATAGTATSYHIGNSLTWASQPDGIMAMAVASGKEHAVGYHIRSGWSLSAIWNNPTNIIKTNSFGGFTTALPNYAWDYVTLQPHHSNTTLASDRQRIVDFIRLNQAGPSTSTNYYIYAAWPKVSSGDYKAFWTQSVSSAPNQLTIHAREYFDHLYNAVTYALGDTATVNVIPVGEVLYRMDLLFESGAVPGFTDISQLYIDDTHLGGDIGGWIAANTVYATLFKENPTGMKKPEGFYRPSSDVPSKLTDALNAQLQALVWDVVSHHPATGIDITPNKFSFTDVSNAQINTTITSNKIQVSGINAAVGISVKNGMYAVNSSGYTSSAGTVRAGDSVSVRLKSASTYSTATNVTLNIGGVSDTFTVTTLSNAGSNSMTIDIRPGIYPNTIFPLTGDSVWVAILTDAGFDSQQINPKSSRFGPLKAAPLRIRNEDVDGDGDMDILLKFNLKDTGIVCGDTKARLIAKTVTGLKFSDSDSILTKGC